MIREKTQKSLDKIMKLKEQVGQFVNGTKLTDKLLKEYIKQKCKDDIQLFALIVFPHYCEHPHSIFHVKMFDILEEGLPKFAVAASRGSAKSSINTVIGTIHDIVYEKEKYILILSSTESQVIQHSKNIITELQDNQRLITLYGKLVHGKRIAASDFITANHIMVSARSSASAIRGLRYGSFRPTKVIGDDLEELETVQNPVTNEKFAEWWNKDVSAIGQPSTKFHVIGTILGEEALLAKLQQNPSYDKHTFPMISKFSKEEKLWEQWKEIYRNKENPNYRNDAMQFFNNNKETMLKDTDILWPERFSYLDLMMKIEEIGLPSFMMEYNMQPIDSSKSLFNNFYFWNYHEGNIKTHTGKILDINKLKTVISVDPTSGSKGKDGDATSIIVAYYDPEKNKNEVLSDDFRLFIVDDFTQNAKPSEWILKMFQLGEAYNSELIIIEENLFKNFLKSSIHDVLLKLKADGLVSHHYNPRFKMILATQNKEKRIMQLEPKINTGRIQFLKDLSAPFWSQLRNYRPNGKFHDDVPDALHILWQHIRGFNGTTTINKNYLEQPRSRLSHLL